ncbi:hypothetical protein ISCGN_005280 [Ixodes scapularis]
MKFVDEAQKDTMEAVCDALTLPRLQKDDEKFIEEYCQVSSTRDRSSLPLSKISQPAGADEETVPLTEESEAEKKGVEDVISIGCLTRRPPPDQRGRVSSSRMYRGRKNDNRTKLVGELGRRNDTTNDEGGWKDCNVSSGEVCVSAGPKTCQSLHPCADDTSTSPTQVVPQVVGGARRPARSYLVAAEEGEELRLSCNGPRGSTSLWTHTGAGDATMPPSGGRTLRFAALQRKHARRYTCHSISASGRLTLADVTLLVQCEYYQ